MTYAGIAGAAQYAVALLHRREDGKAPSVNPPGWRSDANLQRGHLLAKTRLGGKGDYENIVTLFPSANTRMKRPEAIARKALDACQEVFVDIRAHYPPDEPPPDALWPNGLPVASISYEVITDGATLYLPYPLIPNTRT